MVYLRMRPLSQEEIVNGENKVSFDIRVWLQPKAKLNQMFNRNIGRYFLPTTSVWLWRGLRCDHVRVYSTSISLRFVERSRVQTNMKLWLFADFSLPRNLYVSLSQGCFSIDSKFSVKLIAPPGSSTFKNAENNPGKVRVRGLSTAHRSPR